MSKYIKLEDAIEAYNQAVTLLVESEMEEFNLSDFTECSFNTTQIKLIARMIESLPTIEVSEDCISREYILGEAFASDEYNRETKSFDLPVVSVRDIEDAPSVVPSCQKNRQVERAEGEWVHLAGIVYRCSNCNEYTKSEKPFHKPKGNYCPNCGAKMKG